MIQDFLRFLRCLWKVIHFVRGILLVFAFLLLVCAIVIVFSEKRPLGESIYFVLITAMTIGYGDITPTTVLGKAASLAAGILGLILSGLVIAIAVHALRQAAQDMLDQHKEGKQP